MKQEKRKPENGYGYDEQEWGFKDHSEKLEWEEYYKARNKKLVWEDLDNDE